MNGKIVGLLVVPALVLGLADPRRWMDTATLLCLDSDTDGNVHTLDCNGSAFQSWINTAVSFGDQIRHLATGLCLDSNTDGDVYTLSCNGGSFQQWTITDKGIYGYEIRNVDTGWCLDSNPNGKVYTMPCNNGNFQRWH